MTASTSRVVRVFISSTFRDFGVERDLLMKRVFPELRRRARDRFVEVIGVDLRWGITEAQSQKGELRFAQPNRLKRHEAGRT